MSQLQEYVDSQVATISPFKIKSQELLEQAKAKEITDDATAKEAIAIRKLITSHRTEVKNARLAITRNFDSVKSQFIDAEKDVLAPAEEALENISQKILAYQEEQERLAKEEAVRVDAICAKFATNAKSLRSQKACDEKGAELKQIFAELPEADQNHAEIKLAFTKAINELLTRKDELTTVTKPKRPNWQHSVNASRKSPKPRRLKPLNRRSQPSSPALKPRRCSRSPTLN